MITFLRYDFLSETLYRLKNILNSFKHSFNNKFFDLSNCIYFIVNQNIIYLKMLHLIT